MFRIAPGLRVGYVMGVGDEMPAAIRQLGADVRLLDASDLASGDLSRYNVIVTGVRAYERRPDLRAQQQPTARVRPATAASCWSTTTSRNSTRRSMVPIR